MSLYRKHRIFGLTPTSEAATVSAQNNIEKEINLISKYKST
jgi:hypothetical protein